MGNSQSSKDKILGVIKARFSMVHRKWWPLIICALFVILMVPLTVRMADSIKQKYYFEARILQLQSQFNSLKLKIDSQDITNAEISQLKADIEAISLMYQSIDFGFSW